jgi:hypothetical protein
MISAAEAVSLTLSVPVSQDYRHKYHAIFNLLVKDEVPFHDYVPCA